MQSRSRSRVYAPKRKSYSTSRSRSRPVKRVTFPKRTYAIARPTVGLSTSTTTVLRTSFFYNATATVGTGVFTGFLKPGSAFDPCGDLANIQPQMFDQFAAMYNRYKVNSATIRMKITGNGGANATAVWVAAAYPAVDSTALGTYQAAASQQMARTTSGGFNLYTGGGATSFAGSEGKMLTFKLNNSAVVGSKTDAYDNGALVTADPTALQYMLLPFFLQGNAAGAHTWILEIDIWQNVTFSEKKNTFDA